MEDDNEVRREFEPPMMITEALTHYMHMRSELSDFATAYHQVAHRAVTRDDGTEDEGIFKIYRGNAVYFLEHYLVRASDLFDVYIEELIFMIARQVDNFFEAKELQRAKAQLIRLGVDVNEFEIDIQASANLARRTKGNRRIYLT